MSAKSYRNLSFLGACFHSGQPIKGVEYAPAAIRSAGLFPALKDKYKIQVEDFGDVREVSED